MLRTLSALAAIRAEGSMCAGVFDLYGYGQVVLSNAGSNVPGEAAGQVELIGEQVVAHMNGRVYFANECTEGVRRSTDYLAIKLLGKTLKYTTDVSGVGCGCNAAFYLVSMRQNTEISSCNDFYCDANKVCGVACAEVDIQEASRRAWHSTVHSSADSSGIGVGYGGGDSWTGPRDFTSEQYGPGAACIDTLQPIQVAVSFPVDAHGELQAIMVTLTQSAKNCPLTMRINKYEHLAKISQALAAGMTPVASYWESKNMLWMDGKGADKEGPCAADTQHCSASVKFYDFSVESLSGHGPPRQVPSPVAATTPPIMPPAPAWMSSPLMPPTMPPVTHGTVATPPPPLALTVPPVVAWTYSPSDLLATVPPVLPESTTAPPPLPPTLPPVPVWTAATPSPPPTMPSLDGVTSAPQHLPATARTFFLSLMPTEHPHDLSTCSDHGADCRWTHCCKAAGLQCFEKNQWWASCNLTCTPGGIDPEDVPQNRQPWSCRPLGSRTPRSLDTTITHTTITLPKALHAATTTHSHEPLASETTGYLTAGGRGHDEVVLEVVMSEVPHSLVDGAEVVLLVGDQRIQATVAHIHRSPGHVSNSGPSAGRTMWMWIIGILVVTFLIIGACVGWVCQCNDSKVRKLCRVSRMSSHETEFDLSSQLQGPKRQNPKGLILW